MSDAREALRELVGRAEPAVTERTWLLAWLEPLLGLETGGADGDPASIPAAESAAACARLLLYASAGAPAVIAIEDIHWAEPALLDAIGRLVEAFADSPLLVVCTGRPGDGSEEREALPGAEIHLSELSREETRELVDGVAGATPVGEDVREAVVARSGGNPLFALELVRMLTETPGGGETAAVPTSVRAVIGARLDAIPRAHRAMLQDAAVVGTAFWPGALLALADGEGDRPAMLEALAESIRRGLVSPSVSSLIHGEPEYGFTHALIREVAYERLPRRIRAAKHLQAGRWLEGERGSPRRGTPGRAAN